MNPPVVYPPGSVMEILHRAGVDDSAITIFHQHNPKVCSQNPSYLALWHRYLRARTSLSIDDMLPPSLLEHADWDSAYTGIIRDIGTWFASVDQGTPFDWHTHFTTDIFDLFFVNPSTTNTADATPYVHSYHEVIVQGDTADFLRRSLTAGTAELKEHPLWHSPQVAASLHIDSRTFLTTDLSQLKSADHTYIHIWYHNLCQLATATGIDLCPLVNFDPAYALWPKNLSKEIVYRMSSYLLLKIQKATSVDLGNSVLNLIHVEHLQNSDSKLAAYFFLHALLVHAQASISEALAPLPLFSASMDITKFAADIFAYRHNELSKDRKYSNREISLHFLQELDQHSHPVQVELKQIKDLHVDAVVPYHLVFSQLALQYTRANIHSSPGALIVPHAHRLTPNTSGTPRSSTNRSNTTPRTSRGPPPSAAPRPLPLPQPFRQRVDEQCEACGRYGHLQANGCQGVATHFLLQQWIAAHPEKAAQSANKWKEINSRTHRQAIAHTLQ